MANNIFNAPTTNDATIIDFALPVKSEQNENKNMNSSFLKENNPEVFSCNIEESTNSFDEVSSNQVHILYFVTVLVSTFFNKVSV